MKTKCLVLLALLIGVITSNATIISQWTFEVNTPPDLADSAASPAVAAEVGAGTATGVHASALTDWSTPAGNGSANSFSANTWAVGDYWQFSLSTLGFQNITISWDQTSSATGPGEFKLAYQINGGGFVDVGDYIVLPNQAAAPGAGVWNSTTAIPAYSYSASLAAWNNATAVDFRLIMRTANDALPPGTVAATGTDRVDNFTVNGDRISVGVPDTGTTALLLGIPLLMLWTLRRLTVRTA